MREGWAVDGNATKTQTIMQRRSKTTMMGKRGQEGGKSDLLSGNHSIDLGQPIIVMVSHVLLCAIKGGSIPSKRLSFIRETTPAKPPFLIITSP